MDGLTEIQYLIAEECANLRDLLIAKNRAYGNSALDPLRVFSRASTEEQIRVRLDDKLSRLARGQAAGEDPELDILGYLILLRVHRVLAARIARAEAHRRTLPEIPGARDEGGDLVIDAATAELVGYMADPDRVLLRFPGFDVTLPDAEAHKLGSRLARDGASPATLARLEPAPPMAQWGDNPAVDVSVLRAGPDDFPGEDYPSSPAAQDQG